MSLQAENKNKVYALLFTIGFHVLLFLLFILIVFITPIPPFEIIPVPEIEIGLGMEGMGQDAGGSGQNDPDLTTTTDAVKNTVVAENAPNIITDDNETESVIIKSNPTNNNNTNGEVVTAEAPKPTSALQKALDALKSKKEHKGKGEGNGNTGGSGNGTGKGPGDGNDSGEGNKPGGTSGTGGYDLRVRQLVKKPARMTDTEEEGIVVVEIIVDENGKVKKATPGQRGSTTTSASLYAKARLAAYEAKFNPSPDGTAEQRGTYTFVFTLE